MTTTITFTIPSANPMFAACSTSELYKIEKELRPMDVANQDIKRAMRAELARREWKIMCLEGYLMEKFGLLKTN